MGVMVGVGVMSILSIGSCNDQLSAYIYAFVCVGVAIELLI